MESLTAKQCLHKIVGLLEQQNELLRALACPIEPDMEGCPHENIEDISPMGTAPGTQIYCHDCHAFIKGNNNGH